MSTPWSHVTPIAAAALVAAGWRLGCFVGDVRTGRALARASRIFERTHDGFGALVVVAGDSTGVGTGARTPEESIAGLVARAYPAAQLRTVARVGARLLDVPAQLAAVDGRADVLILLAGGNDALSGGSVERLNVAAERALCAARQRAAHVIVLGTANIGLAPLFFWPLTALLARRTAAVRDAVRAACARHHAEYVNFYFTRDDPFSAAPARHYAADGLHPSSETYQYCFEVMRAETALDRVLASS